MLEPSEAPLPVAPTVTSTPLNAYNVAGSAERRVTQRVRIVTEVSLSSESHFFSGLSGDVSTGGIFVSTYQAIEVGCEVEVQFTLPEGIITAHGAVKWTRAHSEGVSPGIGIAFDALSPEHRDMIAQFCERRPPLYYEVGSL